MFEKNRLHFIGIIFLLVIPFSSVLFAEQKNPMQSFKNVSDTTSRTFSLPFITNQGQTDERVQYYVSSPEGTIFITRAGEILYSLKGKDKGKAEKAEKAVLKEVFLNNTIRNIKGDEEFLKQVNYFKGKHPSKWISNLSTYKTVKFDEIYKGVSLHLRTRGGTVEKVFSVQPYANPDLIKIKISGAQELHINKEGQLEVRTAFGTVIFTKPVAFQEAEGDKVPVAISYKCLIRDIDRQKSGITDAQCMYGFTVGKYDPSRELVIDPLLASTYVGGSDEEEDSTITVGPDGSVYVSGATKSIDFPSTTGVYNTENTGDYDVFIAKFDEDFTEMIAATYLGGTEYDGEPFITVDENGEVYVTGVTRSNDFPTTAGAYDSSLGGPQDRFVSKLSADLTTLSASTYFGGSDRELIPSMAIGKDGSIYLTGEIWSSDLPTTPGAYDRTYNGNHDVFLARLNSDLTSLLAGTYLGGNDQDHSYSIGLDENENVYIAGYSRSTNFPTTDGTTFDGVADVFVAKFSNDFTNLLASTLFGGAAFDTAFSLAIAGNGNIFITGETESVAFPTTGAYDNSLGGVKDAFVVRLDEGITTLLASSFLGGSDRDSGSALVIGSDNNIFVIGKTRSEDFPITTDAYGPSQAGKLYVPLQLKAEQANRDDEPFDADEAFITKLDENFTSILASLYLGGSGGENGSDITVGTDGSIYVTGDTESDDFPVTTNTFDISHNGEYDIFAAKFDNLLSAPDSTPTPVPTAEPSLNGTIYGFVSTDSGKPVKKVRIKLKGKNTKVKLKVKTDTDGFFEFENLAADTYKLKANKRGFKKSRKKVKLGEGDEKEIEIMLKKEE